MCPQCRVVKKEKFGRNRLLEELARKIFPQDAVKTVVEAKEKEEVTKLKTRTMSPGSVYRPMTTWGFRIMNSTGSEEQD